MICDEVEGPVVDLAGGGIEDLQGGWRVCSGKLVITFVIRIVVLNIRLSVVLIGIKFFSDG